MKLFIYDDGYGYYKRDLLDGAPLTEGERLRVRYPDDVEEVVVIHIESHRGPIAGHGEPATGDDRAYFVSAIHGAAVRVYVRNALIYAERIE